MSENKNRENYQRSFNKLHLSDDFRSDLEERLEKERKGKIRMFNNSVHGISKIAAAIAIGVITIGSAGVCYANDLGGVRTNFEMWLNGSKQTVEVEEDGNGGYTLTAEDGSERGFGGVALNGNGKETPMSAEELLKEMNNDCFLDTADDGTVTFIYKNIKADVTDSIDENGNLYVHVDDPANEYTYFNISEYDGNGYSYSTEKTPSWGKKYLEVGTADPDSDVVYEREDSEDIEYTTTVTED